MASVSIAGRKTKTVVFYFFLLQRIGIAGLDRLWSRLGCYWADRPNWLVPIFFSSVSFSVF
jgi:hypothetical protein